MGRKGGREVKQGANTRTSPPQKPSAETLRRNPPQKPPPGGFLWFVNSEDHGAASLSRLIRWFPLVRLARLLIPAQALRRNPPQKPSTETLRRNLRRNPPQKPPQKPPAETSNFVFNSNKYSNFFASMIAVSTTFDLSTVWPLMSGNKGRSSGSSPSLFANLDLR